MTEQSIINFILPQRVISSKIEQFLSKLSLNKKARKSKTKNLRISNKLEDKKINKEERKEHKNKKDCDKFKIFKILQKIIKSSKPLFLLIYKPRMLSFYRISIFIHFICQ